MLPFSWVFVVKSFAFVVIAFSTMMTAFAIGPAIETRFFPVVSALSITSMEAIDEDRTRLRASFTKLRPCEYIGIAWFRGTRDEFERVVVILQREDDASSPNRPVGFQRAGPWDVAIPADEIHDNSFAELYHRCNPFWMTTTHFFP